MANVIIIAEVGECFNGSLEIAKKMIDVARDAGCDIVKFQTLDYENISESDPEKDWFKKIALNPEKIGFLIQCAKKIKIGILFTPENIKTAGWLLTAGQKDVKVASSSIADNVLLRFIGKNFKRVFMSTGMASIAEVKKAVAAVNQTRELFIMHCISEYPTGPLLEKRGLTALANDDVRLGMMRVLMDMFPEYKIGYSDHTSGILAPVIAVAMGAKVIEKHITLDQKTPIKDFRKGGKYLGTDHILSIEPHELKKMVKQIREVEAMIDGYKWQRSAGEKMLKSFLRKRFSCE